MKRTHRAFTLREVLIALAVFALGAVVLGSAYVNVLNAYQAAARATQQDDNVRFARAFLLAEPDRTKAEQGGDFDAGDGQRVNWHAKIETTDTADLFRVTFTCEISGTRTPNTAPQTETLYLLRPSWSEGGDSAKLRDKAKQRILELQQKKQP